MLVGAASIYRAFTQSLTIDEAFSYHLYLNRPLSSLFGHYDAVYHVLHTWVTWLVAHKFGKSEIVIRLPSLVAGLWYLAGVWVLCRRNLGNGARCFCGVVLLSSNPLLLDYLSAARGYGAALAFFVWAFDALLTHGIVRASVLLALSVACNLTFLVPAAAAGIVFLAYYAVRREAMLPILWRLILPFLAVAVPILIVPLSHAQASSFYFGAGDLTTSVGTLLAPSVAHDSPQWPTWLGLLQRTPLPAVLAILGLVSTLAARSGELPAILSTGSLVLSTAILIAANHLLGVRYPWGRTGLYLIWLFLASCMLLWNWSARNETPAGKWLSPLLAVICVAICAISVAQFQIRYYYDYRDDTEIKLIMRRVRDMHSAGTGCIGGSWVYDTTVNYYRDRYRLKWLSPMLRTSEPEPGCQYFILKPSDELFIDQLHLRRVWTAPVSGAIFGIPAGG